MANIICEEKLGHAPKKVQLRDLNVAFAEGDTETILSQFTDDIVWRIVGERSIRGKDDVRAAVDEMKAAPVEELRITNILSHGAAGALDGEITMAGGRKIAFCDVYTFSSTRKNANIKQMVSYVIELGEA